MTQDEIWTNIIKYITDPHSGTEKQILERIIKTYSISLRDDKIEQRRAKFKESIRPHVVTFGRDMCNAFFDFWSESSPSGIKMRYEKEPVFDIKKRLQRWFKNENQRKGITKPNSKQTAFDIMSINEAAKAEINHNE